jgi:hypothetical protein
MKRGVKLGHIKASAFADERRSRFPDEEGLKPSRKPSELTMANKCSRLPDEEGNQRGVSPFFLLNHLRTW